MEIQQLHLIHKGHTFKAFVLIVPHMAALVVIWLHIAVVVAPMLDHTQVEGIVEHLSVPVVDRPAVVTIVDVETLIVVVRVGIVDVVVVLWVGTVDVDVVVVDVVGCVGCMAVVFGDCAAVLFSLEGMCGGILKSYEGFWWFGVDLMHCQGLQNYRVEGRFSG